MSAFASLNISLGSVTSPASYGSLINATFDAQQKFDAAVTSTLGTQVNQIMGGFQALTQELDAPGQFVSNQGIAMLVENPPGLQIQATASSLQSDLAAITEDSNMGGGFLHMAITANTPAAIATTLSQVAAVPTTALGSALQCISPSIGSLQGQLTGVLSSLQSGISVFGAVGGELSLFEGNIGASLSIGLGGTSGLTLGINIGADGVAGGLTFGPAGLQAGLIIGAGDATNPLTTSIQQATMPSLAMCPMTFGGLGAGVSIDGAGGISGGLSIGAGGVSGGLSFGAGGVSGGISIGTESVSVGLGLQLDTNNIFGSVGVVADPVNGQLTVDPGISATLFDPNIRPTIGLFDPVSQQQVGYLDASGQPIIPPAGQVSIGITNLFGGVAATFSASLPPLFSSIQNIGMALNSDPLIRDITTINSSATVATSLLTTTREITTVVVGSSETFKDQDVRASNVPGWHFLITRTGELQQITDLNQPGNFNAAYNEKSIGIVLAGGLNATLKEGQGQDKSKFASFDSYTPAQLNTFDTFMKTFLSNYPYGQAIGYSDIPETNSTQPGFDVRSFVKSRFNLDTVIDPSRGAPSTKDLVDNMTQSAAGVSNPGIETELDEADGSPDPSVAPDLAYKPKFGAQ